MKKLEMNQMEQINAGAAGPCSWGWTLWSAFSGAAYGLAIGGPVGALVGVGVAVAGQIGSDVTCP